MSAFGETSRNWTPPRELSCPCESGLAYGRCCAPFHDGEPAPTAVQLMRARFCAYCVANVDFLFRTWHPRTRPEAIEPDVTWLGLRVGEVEAGGAQDSEGVVEFRARGEDLDGVIVELRERSRFARRGGRWVYVDGDAEMIDVDIPDPERVWD